MATSLWSSPKLLRSSMAVNISPTMPMRMGSAGLSSGMARKVAMASRYASLMSRSSRQVRMASIADTQAASKAPRSISKPALAR